jgi:serine/threonine protein phosphatase PrpC
MGAQLLTWESAARSHVGNVRKLNEDALLDRPDLGIWVVADGMGGHQAGDVASRLIVDSLDQLNEGPAEAREEAVCTVLCSVNQRLRSMAQARGQNAIIGSTVAVLLGGESSVVSLWVGDSRVYLLRDGVLRQLTRDHSQVEELIERGVISRAEAETHPAANVITRAVGAADGVMIDRHEEPALPGDVYLLCSDGLNKAVPEAEITQVLAGGSCADSAQALLHLGLVRGAKDNLSVVVVHAEEGGLL